MCSVLGYDAVKCNVNGLLTDSARRVFWEENAAMWVLLVSLLGSKWRTGDINTLDIITGQRNVPNVFIKGKHLVGNDVVWKVERSDGKLALWL